MTSVIAYYVTVFSNKSMLKKKKKKTHHHRTDKSQVPHGPHVSLKSYISLNGNPLVRLEGLVDILLTRVMTWRILTKPQRTVL